MSQKYITPTHLRDVNSNGPIWMQNPILFSCLSSKINYCRTQTRKPIQVNFSASKKILYLSIMISFVNDLRDIISKLWLIRIDWNKITDLFGKLDPWGPIFVLFDNQIFHSSIGKLCWDSPTLKLCYLNVKTSWG